jgi:hypothetical protein
MALLRSNRRNPAKALSQRLTRQLFDRTHRTFFGSCKKRDRSPLFPARPVRPILWNIILRHDRNIIVDHMRDRVLCRSASRDVCSDQNSGFARLETPQSSFRCDCERSPWNSVRSVRRFSKTCASRSAPRFSPRKDQNTLKVFFIKQLKQQRHFDVAGRQDMPSDRS